VVNLPLVFHRFHQRRHFRGLRWPARTLPVLDIVARSAAFLTSEAEVWGWSTAAAHCGAEARNEILDLEVRRKSWIASAWRQYLAAGEIESKVTEIRRSTHTGRPLGSAEFVQALEGSMRRRLAPQKGGRPPKTGLDARQS
jgi:hypothetical protein